LPVGSSAGVNGPNGLLPSVGLDGPLAPGIRRRRKNKDANLIASAILVVISVILVIVLVLVWKRQNASAEDETTPPAQSIPVVAPR
jgi:hypothetical protein